MAKGTITQVSTQTTGKVRVDDNEGYIGVPNGTEIIYDDATLPAKGGVVVGENVSFTIAPNGPGQYKATTIQKQVVADPDFPATNEGDLYVPVVGDLDIDGRTVTVRGATVNGNVNLSNGGKLILTSTAEDGAQRARVTGSIFALANSTCKLTIYKSDVNGSIRFSNNSEVKFKGGSVGGDVDIRNSAKATKNNGSVGGDVDIRNMTNGVSVDGLTLTGTGKNLDIRNNRVSAVLKNIVVNHGDATVRNNQGCSYSNITAPGGTVDIGGCTLIP
ncbi:MAG: hypothetical protein AAB221_16250 [Bacteroidota bacterium]